MAHQPMLRPDPSEDNVPERHLAPEESFSLIRGPEWLEEDSGNYLAELAAKLAAHGGGESSADLALDLMLNKIVDQARLATAASGAAIAVSRDGEMVCRASVGDSAPGLGVRLNMRSGVSGACVQSRTLQRCDDAENDRRADAAACRDAEIRSILAVPILEGQELLGVLEVFAARTKAFDESDVYAVQALSRRIVENLRRADEVASPVTDKPEDEPKTAPEPLPFPIATSSVSYSVQQQPEADSQANHEQKSRNQSYDQREDQREHRDETQSFFTPPKLLFENEPAARRDYWTPILSWVVIALALVLGWMVARAGWKTAVSLYKGETDSAALTLEAQATGASSKKKSPNFGIMSAPVRWVGKKNDSASSQPSTSEAPQPKEEAEPPFAGGLRVYQNGRVIFRIGPSEEKPAQTPVELAAQTTTSEVTPADSATGAAPRTISATVINSYLIKKVEPEYPEQAKQDHVEGPVVLNALVGSDGTVKDVRVLSGDPRLVDAVSKAVRGWLFKPYAPEGKPIEFETQITVNFSLSQENQEPSTSTPQ
jgi:TonB family protein